MKAMRLEGPMFFNDYFDDLRRNMERRSRCRHVEGEERVVAEVRRIIV